ncbi:MAG: response regulator transcription factor [Propionicimonas sp.]|uniref:response regulator transcription factor n=1 Tax=Propionicimonas sp. TaxID=1955623 RepID=UPI003D0DD844
MDDDPIVRDSLAAFLAPYDDLQLAGTCSDGAQAINAVAADPPDIVLMDINMTPTDGIATTRAITTASPSTRILAITALASDTTIADILNAGAQGAILKNTRPQILADAIRTTHHGIALLPAETLKRWSKIHRTPPPGPTTSTREQQVLELLQAGLTNRQIANTLHVSPSTVKADVSNLLKHYSATTRTQLAAQSHNR